MADTGLEPDLVVLINDEPKGPLTFRQVWDLWQAGAVSGDTWYVRDGMEEWRPLSELQRGLQELFGPVAGLRASQGIPPPRIADITPACPRCRGSDIQTIEMAYRTGISNMSGIGVGYDHGLAVAGFEGVQVTNFAASLAPPQQKKADDPIIAMVFLTAVICAVALALVFWADAPHYVYVIAGILSVVVILKGLAEYRVNRDWNKDKFPELFHLWNSSWICRRCGCTWVP